MARGRIIDKSFYENEDVAKLSVGARLMYSGTIVYSDDEGRMKAAVVYLKAKLFPFDQATRIDTIKAWRDEIVSTGLIKLYAAGGTEYLYHPNWNRWQPIRKDRAHPSDCPSPTKNNQLTTKCQPVDNQMPAIPNQTVPDQTVPDQTEPNQHITASKSRASPDGKPKAPKTAPTGDHQRMREHVCATYLAKSPPKSKYLFLKEDGGIVKFCLRNWTVEECMALWDEFLSQNWDFEGRDGKLVKVAHSLRNFQTKVRVLVESNNYKIAAKKYAEKPAADNPLAKLELKGVPAPAINGITLDQARRLQEMSKP